MKKRSVFSAVSLFLAGAAAAFLVCVFFLNARFGGRDGIHRTVRLAQAMMAIEQSYVQEIDGDTLAIAAYGALAKHPVHIFMPDWVSIERVKLMKMKWGSLIKILIVTF